MIALADVGKVTDADVIPLLPRFTPSGVLAGVAADNANPGLDALINQGRAIQDAVARHLAIPTIVERLKDDLAIATPAIVDAVNTVDGYWIPLVSALAGPAAPFVSFGLKVALALLLAGLKMWAASHEASKQKKG